MDVALSRAIHDTVRNAPEYSRIVTAIGSSHDFDNFLHVFVSALIRTLLKKTTECKHILSLCEEFVEKRMAAIVGGPTW